MLAPITLIVWSRRPKIPQKGRRTFPSPLSRLWLLDIHTDRGELFNYLVAGENSAGDRARCIECAATGALAVRLQDYFVVLVHLDVVHDGVVLKDHRSRESESISASFHVLALTREPPDGD